MSCILGKRVRKIPSSQFFTSFCTDLYVNPVLPGSYSEPGVLVLPDNSGFVLVSSGPKNTDDKEGGTFPLLFSTDLTNWDTVNRLESALSVTYSSDRICFC